MFWKPGLKIRIGLQICEKLCNTKSCSGTALRKVATSMCLSAVYTKKLVETLFEALGQASPAGVT